MKITKDRQIEQEANYFAMCLLMPDFLVKIEIEKLKMKGFTESSIRKSSSWKYMEEKYQLLKSF